ncbi:MAG: beta-lactamase family protein [Myxococcales bacterium]|nr:beta-lactamase family protein [Myxococcales bacterium]
MRALPPALSLLLAACTGTPAAPADMRAHDAAPAVSDAATALRDAAAPRDARAAALDAALARVVAADPSVPGVLLAVRAPGFTYAGAAGRARLRGRPLAPTDLFRAASVTKTFVAAAALVLVERGTLRLDEPIAARLTPATAAALRADGYATDVITLRQLLGHTAGVFDYTEAPSFYATLLLDPTHRWTRAEQIALAMSEGRRQNAPGAAYHYGDTHYLLAAEIIEVATGRPLAAALRELLQFERLGLTDTWLESLEPAPADAAARFTHPYIEDTDTRGWDPSWDLFGGGGLVSSTRDLVRFFDALFAPEGGVFTRPETRATFTTMPAVGRGAFFGIDGGLGINRLRVDGVECYAGYGFFTTQAVHCPALDLTFAATLNQAEPRDDEAIIEAVLSIVPAR